MRSPMRSMLLATAAAAAWSLPSAVAQETRTPETKRQSEDPGQSEEFGELHDAGRQLREQVAQRLQQAGQEQDVNIDKGKVMISLTDQGMIVGAAASEMPGSTSTSPSTRTPRDTTGQENRPDDDDNLPGGQGQRPGGAREFGEAGNEDVSGIVFVTGDLNRQLADSSPMGRTPEDPSSPPTTREPETGTTGNERPGRSMEAWQGSHVYKVVCRKGSDRVELQDSTGRVATSFPLIKTEKTASVPGAQRSGDTTANRTNPDAPRQEPVSRPGMDDGNWALVYASIVCGLTRES